MEIQNLFDKIKFTAWYFSWAFLGMVWYKSILFRCLENCSFRVSKLVLWGFLIAFFVIGFWSKRMRERPSFDIFINLVTAFGCYTVLCNFQIRGNTYISVLLGAAILSAAYAIDVISRRTKKKRCKKITYVEKIVTATQIFFGFGFALILLISGGNIFFGTATMKAVTQPATASTVNEQTIASNIDTILLLQEDCWKELTVKERLNVLQTVANIEQRYLGISNELNVGAANLEENLNGKYSDNTHEIVINIDKLEKVSSWEMLNTVCHEVYHSYQHRMADLYYSSDEHLQKLRLFRKAAVYADELENYIDGDDDFYGYYAQQCETDAREYAESAVEDYIYRILEYLETEAVGDEEE